ncbi:MAG: hypothetical protein ACP5JG_11225 [Anaerolineae bacterium]
MVRNAWALWLFPGTRPVSTGSVILDVADDAFGHRLGIALPDAISLRDLDSLVRGCRSWAGKDAPAAMAKLHRPTVISDHWGEGVVTCLAQGALPGGDSLRLPSRAPENERSSSEACRGSR